MNDNEFEQLWQEAAARSMGHRLAEGYPQWQRNRRRAMGLAAVVAVAVGVAVPVLAGQAGHGDFDHVYCNRSGIADSQWASLANDLLMEC